MLYHLLANTLIVIHLTFVGFVIFGALMVIRWPKVAWVHVPAALWGGVVELGGFICPLTPLENYFRQHAGLVEYHTGFIERYVLPVLYPAQLTRSMQIMLGVAVLVLNVCIYAWIVRRLRTKLRYGGRR